MTSSRYSCAVPSHYKEDEQYQFQFAKYIEAASATLNEKPVVLLDWYENRKSAKTDPNNWGRNFKGKNFIEKLDDDCGGCWHTNDRNFEKSADGIIVDNTWFLFAPNDAPSTKNRAKNQYWISHHRESATKGFDYVSEFLNPRDEYGNSLDQAYNLTTSYRRDSDIPFHPLLNDIIITVRYRHGELRMPDDEYMNKLLLNKFQDMSKNYITWIVSNCDATTGARERMSYVKELQNNGMKFDGFGTCFDDGSESSSTQHAHDGQKDADISSRGIQWRGDTGSVIEKISKYKFYLAFENGVHCNDYLSEKFWRNSLEAQLVPIIFGTHKDDVKALAPPNSYIHVEDFGTKAQLVEYLNYLHNNDTAYMVYHNWRTIKPDLETPLDTHIRKRICGSCKLLNKKKSENYPVRMIKSVSSWWWMNMHDEKCLNSSSNHRPIPEELKAIVPPVSMEDNWYDELIMQGGSESL